MRTHVDVKRSIDELTEKRDALREEADALKDNPDVGQQERFHRLVAGSANVHRQIEALRREYGEIMLRGVEDGTFGIESGDGGVPVPGEYRVSGSDSSLPGPLRAMRDRGLRTVDRAVRSTLLPERAAEKITALIEQGPMHERSIAARWASTTGDPAYLGAFAKLLADPDRGHLLWNAEEATAYRAVEEFRAASLTDSAGGYMVPFTLDPSVILTSDGTINPLRRISRVVTTTTESWNGVSSAGVTASWDAEATEVSDDAPTLAQPSIAVHKMQAFVPFSIEVGMDAASWGQEMTKLLLDAADVLQATAFTTGSGSGQPFGIITALDDTSSELSPATAEVFAAADIYATQNALPPRFQARAQWCAEISTINKAAQFETAAGARLFPELAESRLLRKPLNENSDMRGFGDINTAATAENPILLYGDFSNYVIADRIGTTIELVPHLFGTGHRPTGQRGLYLVLRTGADSVNDSAFRLMDIDTAA